MASKGLSRSLKTLRASITSPRDPLIQCLAPRLSRSIATESTLSSKTITRSLDGSYISPYTPAPPPSLATTVPITLYSFPSLQPLRFLSYPSSYLHLPLRRDLLHRAVIFEGDLTRQGTASSKTRYEVHGSHRKIRPQKGLGRARLGTRQSPMLKGGGKSFGPHPRDFATGLPRKMYDLAFRTALSLRWRRGELVVVEKAEIEVERGPMWGALCEKVLREVFGQLGWGNEGGRSLVVTGERREGLFTGLEACGEEGRADVWGGVDVKDLLGMGRVVVEREALERMLRSHRSDLHVVGSEPVAVEVERSV